jgi:hypothetical protein
VSFVFIFFAVLATAFVATTVLFSQPAMQVTRSCLAR